MIEGTVLLAVLILSIIVHEVAHGFMANSLGDPTARLAGRLSMNPFKHVDVLGSIVIPAFLYFSNAGFLFGWAKPVPYNPYNIRAPFGLSHKWAEALVAIAGPATNMLLALIFAGFAHMSSSIGGVTQASASFIGYVVYMNVMLALFNLIPIPPLDGSKVIGAFLPRPLADGYTRFLRGFEQYGVLASFAFIFVFIQFFSAPFQQLVHIVMMLILPA